MKAKLSWWISVVLWSWGALSAARACVGCREPGSETLRHESSTVMAGFAFSWSVLFMLTFAFLVVGGMSLYIWQTCRRIDRERARS
jgi:hypothetical protein